MFDAVLPRLLPFPLPAAGRGLVAKLLGLDEIGRIYEALQTIPGETIADRLLTLLSVRCAIDDVDLLRIPRTGPAILTANHPFGILEGAVLASLLRRVRPDARFLANGLLATIPELRDLVIPVDPVSGRSAAGENGRGLRRSMEHLAAGGLLVIFPAGEVSHLHWRQGIADPEWNPAVARMVAIAARRGISVPVVPAYVAGANSVLFQAAGLAHPRLRTALLIRELLNKRGRRVEVRVGAPIESDKLLGIPTSREQVDYLRWRTYLLGRRERHKALTSQPLRRLAEADGEPIAPAVDPDLLAAEIAALSPLLRSGDLEVYLADAAHIPNVLRELGRLREITFRAAGEGTGKALDLDRFDDHYLHLFVWNARRRELAGAYRLCPADRPLYTETLFHYSPGFLERLGPAVELGRSFVRLEYQKCFAPLLLLWKGIGAFIGRNPQYKTLFGPVSISNQYAAISRELMVGFLEKYAMLRGWTNLVRARMPLRRRLDGAGLPSAGVDVDDLSAILGDVEQRETGVPVLLRQYLRLGGKLLGFNVDSKFANALDGLILVDLTKTEPKLLDRYLGRAEAAAFLAFQKGTHGTHESIRLDELGAAADRRGNPGADALL
jgi:putative hemolysin